MEIIKRDVEELSVKYLETDEILLFTGPRQSGKTTILEGLQRLLESKGNHTIFLDLEDQERLSVLNQTPKNIFQLLPIDLNAKTYIFIDEIQYLQNPTNFLKYLYDEYAGKIKLIVSGSSAFYIDRKFKDSLAGRKIIFTVLPLSFREFLRFKKEERLLSLLPGKFDSKNYLLLKQISIIEQEAIRRYFDEFITYGGYPRVVLAPLESKVSLLRELAYAYVKKDVLDSNIRQDEIFYRLFRFLSSQVGGLVNTNELSNSLGVSRKTIDNYLYVMRKSFHIFLARPFFNNVRKEFSKMPKVYFFDLGLRNVLMNDFNLPRMRSDRGAILENAVFRQLLGRVEGDAEYDIKFWRLRDGHEIDFVFADKIAFEAKAGATPDRVAQYTTFSRLYPKIPLNYVSFTKSDSPTPVWEPWLI